MEIKRATLEDATVIQQLFQYTIDSLSSSTFYSDIQLSEWKKSGESIAFWEEKIHLDYFIKAILNHKIVGFASLTSEKEVDMLYVAPFEQRKKIGSFLLQTLITEAKQRNYDIIYTDSSDIAKDFFLSHSFRLEKIYHKIKNEVSFENSMLYLTL